MSCCEDNIETPSPNVAFDMWKGTAEELRRVKIQNAHLRLSNMVYTIILDQSRKGAAYLIQTNTGALVFSWIPVPKWLGCRRWSIDSPSAQFLIQEALIAGAFASGRVGLMREGAVKKPTWDMPYFRLDRDRLADNPTPDAESGADVSSP